MEDIIFLKNKENLTPEELISFWASIGWGEEDYYKNEVIMDVIRNTPYFYFARNQESSLVAVARVFSDGYIHTSLAEIAVLSNYRGRGVGKKIMRMIKDDFGETSIFLEAFEENEKFFEKCGYIKRDNMKVYSKRYKK